MCIAIYKPEGQLIPQETLERCFNANPDGAGYMFHKNNKLYIKKGFFTFKEFWSSYKRDKSKQTVIHFRIKTHGLINKDNCHPYQINEEFAFVHNGVISGYTDPEKSDTWLFNEAVIQPLVKKWGNLSIFEDPVKNLLESRIGYSKLIFMDNKGNVDIFNESKGIWDGEIWYSNSSFQAPKLDIKPDLFPSPQRIGYYIPTSIANKYYDNSNTWQYKKDNLESGSLVTLIYGHYDRASNTHYSKNSIWEVLEVNSDYTVNLISDYTSDIKPIDTLYNIRFSDIKIYDVDPVGTNTSSQTYYGDSLYD